MKTSTTLTLAAIEFVQPPPLHDQVPWVLWPSATPLSREAFAAALDAVPRPVLVSAHAEARAATATAITPERLAEHPALAHGLRNQRQYLQEKLGALGDPSPQTTVLLELPGARLIITVDDIASWVDEVALTSVGWTLDRNGDDEDTPLRLFFLGPDGQASPGRSCPVRPAAS